MAVTMDSKNNDTYLARWLENRLSEDDLQEFHNSEQHEEYLRIKEASDQLALKPFNVDKGWQRLQNETNTEEEHATPRVARRRIFYYLSAAAAAVLFLLYVGNFFSSGMDSFTTEMANQESLVMSDQSSFRLNADSEVKYNEEKWSENRSLTLKGEAFIDVPRKGAFEVITDNGRVSVMGTSFNVYSREDRFRVECYTGTVRVEIDRDNFVILKKGEASRLKDGSLVSYKIQSPKNPSWMNGVSHFESQRLKVVVDELQRQYDIPVTLKRLHNEVYTGDFVQNDIDKALHQITEVMGLKYDKNEDEIVIY